MQAVKLNNGTSLPAVGFGMWQMWDEAECISAVKAALAAGYRHFDTAQYYENEAWLADAIKQAGVPREDVFITTKIANANFAPDLLEPSFEQSLTNLGSDYVDLLLLHFPEPGLRQGAWKQLEGFAVDGRAKAIGVSNYTIRHLEELLADCQVKPAVNQVELHVFLQQPELRQYCADHDIVVEAYSPLAQGHAMDNPTLDELAKAHGKTPAQIMVRWCLQAGTVPLPKSVKPQRIKSNVDVFDFELSDGDMAKLAKLDQDRRYAWDPTDVE